MRILCIGISHKTADVALREKLAFDAGQVRCALAELAGRWKQAEFVVLSTCNRTELYTARPIHGHPREEELRHWLGEFRGIGPAEYDAALYTLTDANAVRQLFAVAAGLDSLVVGEAQIASQLKEAYAQALQASAARTVMNKLFQRAFRAAKEIRSETQLADGKVSIASVAIDFVARAFETLKAKRVLNVGAGKMNELMLKHLAGLGVGQILVANRSPQRAAELAAAVGAKAVAMEELAERLGQVDIVLTSTASPEPIITRKMIETAQRRRKCQPLLIVDIAVPRDVEAGVGELKNVSLYNIDDLEQIVRGTLKRRHTQLAAAEAILSRHVAKILRSLNIRDVAPTIDALYRRMQLIAEEELAAAGKKLSAHEDAEEDKKILRRALHRTIRRIMHPAAANLRRSAGDDAARAQIAALRKLFDLDEK